MMSSKCSDHTVLFLFVYSGSWVTKSSQRRFMALLFALKKKTKSNFAQIIGRMFCSIPAALVLMLLQQHILTVAPVSVMMKRSEGKSGAVVKKGRPYPLSIRDYWTKQELGGLLSMSTFLALVYGYAGRHLY